MRPVARPHAESNRILERDNLEYCHCTMWPFKGRTPHEEDAHPERNRGFRDAPIKYTLKRDFRFLLEEALFSCPSEDRHLLLGVPI